MPPRSFFLFSAPKAFGAEKQKEGLRLAFCPSFPASLKRRCSTDLVTGPEPLAQACLPPPSRLLDEGCLASIAVSSFTKPWALRPLSWRNRTSSTPPRPHPTPPFRSRVRRPPGTSTAP